MQYSVPPMLLVSDIIYCSEATTLISRERKRKRERKREGKEEKVKMYMYDTMRSNMREI